MTLISDGLLLKGLSGHLEIPELSYCRLVKVELFLDAVRKVCSQLAYSNAVEIILVST